MTKSKCGVTLRGGTFVFWVREGGMKFPGEREGALTLGAFIQLQDRLGLSSSSRLVL